MRYLTLVTNTVSTAFADLNFLVFLHRIITKSDKLDVVAQRLTILTRTVVVPSSNFGPTLTDVSYILRLFPRLTPDTCHELCHDLSLHILSNSLFTGHLATDRTSLNC